MQTVHYVIVYFGFKLTEHNEGGPPQRMSTVIATDNARIQQSSRFIFYSFLLNELTL